MARTVIQETKTLRDMRDTPCVVESWRRHRAPRLPGSHTLAVGDSKAMPKDAGPLALQLPAHLAGLALRLSPSTSWSATPGLPELSNFSP